MFSHSFATFCSSLWKLGTSGGDAGVAGGMKLGRGSVSSESFETSSCSQKVEGESLVLVVDTLLLVNGRAGGLLLLNSARCCIGVEALFC